MRIRHAYGQLGGFLAGQTWSTFMDLKALPEKIDFGSPAGRTFVRQAMLRYSHKLGPGTLDLALESSETTLTASDGSRAVRDDDRVPDLVTRYAYDGNKGHLAAAVLTNVTRSAPRHRPGTEPDQC